MTSPLPLPAWVPWWVHLAILLVLLFLALMYLLMPFSVFGLRSRLEAIDARLDEIQGEIRSLAMRLPDAAPYHDYEEEVRVRPRPGARPPVAPPSRPPIPPPPARSGRTEPRLY